MSYLVDPKSAADFISQTCATSDIAADGQINGFLRVIASRIASIMNVKTLDRVMTTDYFKLPSVPSYKVPFDNGSGHGVPQVPVRTQKLRLTNGFVDLDTIAFVDSTGATVLANPDATYPFLDERMGIVEITNPWNAGVFAVTYLSGLPLRTVDFAGDEYPDDYPPVLDVTNEQWIEGGLMACLALLERTVPLDVKIDVTLRSAYPFIDAAVRQELAAYVYQSYQRPRYNCLFPFNTKQQAIP